MVTGNSQMDAVNELSSIFFKWGCTWTHKHEWMSHYELEGYFLYCTCTYFSQPFFSESFNSQHCKRQQTDKSTCNDTKISLSTPTNEDTKMNIINLSLHSLTAHETQHLMKGLGFCPGEDFDKFYLIKDLNLFTRKLLLKIFITKKQMIQHS